MPNIPNPQSEFLREPNLLVPGKKPIGHVIPDYNNTLLSGCIGMWPFLVPDAKKVTNLINQRDNGVVTGGALSYQANGNGIEPIFSSSNYLNCGTDLQVTTGFTFSLWLYSTGGTHPRIISRHGLSGNYGFAVARLTTSDAIWMGVSSNGTAWSTANTSSNSLVINTRYHVVLRYDGAQIRCWINGLEDTGGGFPWNYSSDINVSPNSWEIGRDSASGIEWEGQIDNVIVWDVAIPESVIEELYRDPYHLLIPA